MPHRNLVHFDMQQATSTVYIWDMHPSFDNLLRANPFSPGSSVLDPGLAKSWKISDDGLTYTLNLRAGVKWHDGTDFTAQDVKATYDRIAFPPEGIFSVNKELFAALSEVTVVDPLTVQFVLNKPRGLFLTILAEPRNAVMQKKVLEDNNFDLKRVFPIPGTGPFTFADIQLGEFARYEKNPDYWNPNLPYLDEFIAREVAWGAATTAAFIAGQADVVWGLQPQTFDDLKDDPEKIVGRFPGTSPQHLVLNTKRAPFNDVRVRRAVHLGLNYPAVRESVESVNLFGPAGWLLPGDPRNVEYWASAKDQPGWRRPTAEDIAEAKQLLADAGYGGGIKDLTIRGRSTAGSPLIVTTIQGLLKQTLGIDANILLDNTPVHYEQIGLGDFDLAETGASQPLPLVHFLWTDLFGTDAPRNWSGYSSAEFDALMQNILVELDEAELKNLISQGIDILDRDVPVLMWGHGWNTFGFLKHVKGLPLEHSSATSMQGRVKMDTVWVDQ